MGQPICSQEVTACIFQQHRARPWLGKKKRTQQTAGTVQEVLDSRPACGAAHWEPLVGWTRRAFLGPMEHSLLYGPIWSHEGEERDFQAQRPARDMSLEKISFPQSGQLPYRQRKGWPFAGKKRKQKSAFALRGVEELLALFSCCLSHYMPQNFIKRFQKREETDSVGGGGDDDDAHLSFHRQQHSYSNEDIRAVCIKAILIHQV